MASSLTACVVGGQPSSTQRIRGQAGGALSDPCAGFEGRIVVQSDTTSVTLAGSTWGSLYNGGDYHSVRELDIGGSDSAEGRGDNSAWIELDSAYIDWPASHDVHIDYVETAGGPVLSGHGMMTATTFGAEGTTIEGTFEGTVTSANGPRALKGEFRVCRGWDYVGL